MKLKWSPHYSFLYLRFITPQQGQLGEKTDYTISYTCYWILSVVTRMKIYILRSLWHSWNVLCDHEYFHKIVVFHPNHSLYSLAIRFVCVYFPKANTINFWKVEYKNVFPYAIIAVALAIKYEIEWRMEICCLFYVGKNVLFLAF